MESLRWAAGGIIVLRVEGKVDLYTLPSLRAALDEGLDRYPAHLVVDLGRMTFESGALCWDGDCPVRYRSTEAAVTATRVSQRRTNSGRHGHMIGEVCEATQPEPRLLCAQRVCNRRSVEQIGSDVVETADVEVLIEKGLFFGKVTLSVADIREPRGL